MSFQHNTSSFLGQSKSPSFKPGSIFFEDPTSSSSSSTSSTSMTLPSNTTDNTNSGDRARPPTLNVPLDVALASPPPSPSRNSIFDQPWSAPRRPNITSLRASTTSTSSSSSLNPTRDHNITTATATQSTPLSTTITTSYSNKLNHLPNKNNNNNYNNQPIAATTDDIICTRAQKSHNHETSLSSSSNNNTLSVQGSIANPNESSSFTTTTTTTTPSAILITKQSSLPSPSMSPTAPILRPISFLFDHLDSSPPFSTTSPQQIQNDSPFSLTLERTKLNLLGHGRHADVYKALIHPSSTPMREYLLSRKAKQSLESLSCSDFLLSHSKENLGDNAFDCAAKCLNPNPDSQSTGLSEANILKRLNSHNPLHPGRLSLVDYLGLYNQTTGEAISPINELAHDKATQSETKDSKWTILLEYCQNGSIWDWIRQNPEKVGLRQWLTWAIQLVQAVDYIHEAGLVHHDIKPHNILLDGSLGAKLSDFGAGIFHKDGETLSLDEGYGRGTPPYSAPEMFASAADARYTKAVDIYSLGVALYVIGLTAQEPFHRVKNPMEMIIWIKKGGFWLMEDQTWVHDRGPVPKVTSSSNRLSTSSTALSALAHHSHLHNHQESKLKSRPSSSNLLNPNLPPINTNLSFDQSAITPSSASSPGLKESPMLLPVGSTSHQLSVAYSPDRSLKSSLPSTPVSPLPFPSPLFRSQTPRPRGEDQPRKSGETIMRFLNGEVVEYQVIQLLKDMSHMDPTHRPDTKSILQRLQLIQEQLDAEMKAEAEAEAQELNHSNMDIE